MFYVNYVITISAIMFGFGLKIYPNQPFEEKGFIKTKFMRILCQITLLPIVLVKRKSAPFTENA